MAASVMESTLQMLWHVFFPLPDSILVKVMCLVSLGALAYLGMAEVRGKHLQYSKFWNAKSMKSVSITKVRLSGKVGMTIAYAPGLLAALASFAISPSLDSARLDLLRCALALHFAKRIFEIVMLVMTLKLSVGVHSQAQQPHDSGLSPCHFNKSQRFLRHIDLHPISERQPPRAHCRLEVHRGWVVLRRTWWQLLP